MDVDVEVIPEAKRGVMVLRCLHVLGDTSSHLLRVGVDVLDVLGDALVVLGADVERQIAVLAAGINEILRGIDLVLIDVALALQDVGPAAAADGEVQS